MCVCVCLLVEHMHCVYIDINYTQTFIHKLDCWRSKQSFHCSFCWSTVPRPPALLYPSPLQGGSSLDSLASQDIFSSQENKAQHSKLGATTSVEYFQMLLTHQYKVGKKDRYCVEKDGKGKQIEVNAEAAQTPV